MSTKRFMNFVFVFGKHNLASELSQAATTKKSGSTLANTKLLSVYKIRTKQVPQEHSPDRSMNRRNKKQSRPGLTVDVDQLYKSF